MRLLFPFSPQRYAVHSRISHPGQLPQRRGSQFLCTSESPRRAEPPSQKDSSVLRLMPLGGSITCGVGSSHGTGYRKLLLQMLGQQGINVRMVGSRKDGSILNNEHEGWRGFRIDEVERKARKSAERLSPDIFMVNAGSNDCLQAFQTTGAGERMNKMLDFLWLACPQSTILLSTLIVSTDKEVDSVVRNFNNQFRALVEKKAAERKRIVLVDMYSAEGPDVRGLVDGIHPDDEGYDKMAQLWLRGIQEAIHNEFFDISKYKF